MVFNICLPDAIFERDSSGNKKLVKFTYKNRFNLISQSNLFVNIIANVTFKALKLLINPGKPKYTYKKLN